MNSSAIRQSGFKALWAGQTISVLGSQLSGIAIPVLAVKVLEANEWQMGILNAADTAAFLLVGLIAGAWVDRWRKRQVMIWADLVRMAALAVLPISWWMGSLTMWHLIVVSAIIGLASVFFDVAYQSYVPILLHKDAIGDGNSKLETTNQIAGIASPALVGWLLTLIKAPILLAIDALSYLLSAFSLALIKDRELPKPKEERKPLKHEIAEGLKFVWHQKFIRAISFTTASSNFFASAAGTLLPLLLLRDLELSASAYGLIFSISSIGGLLGAVTTTRLIKRFGEGPVIAGSAVAMGLAALSIMSVVIVDSQYVVLVAGFSQFVMSFTILTYNITQVTARQRLCPEHLLGRMNASIRFMVWGTMPIGATLGGAVGSIAGVVPTMTMAYIGCLLAAGFVVFSPLRKMKELPTHPEH